MPIATSNFLIPNATFIVELVAFLVVLAVIGKYVLPFLNNALTDRAERIRTELEAANEARADAAAADEARRAELEAARQQAREIVAHANRTADQVAGEGQARGQAEYERLVASAEAEVQLARSRAVEDAAARLGDLVLEVVEKIIGREVDARAHRDLINEAVAALDTGGGASGTASTGIGRRS
jgi:F-type H+-transporting ATPase subunit b